MVIGAINLRMGKKKMLTPRQYAETIGKPYPTVMYWLQLGLVPQAVKQETPTGHFWTIPEGTKAPELKRGRKPGTKKSDAAKNN